MDTKLTDFDHADLLTLCVTLKAEMLKALENVQFLQAGFPDSDLLPYYEKKYDSLQRLYVQAEQACIHVNTLKIIASN